MTSELALSMVGVALLIGLVTALAIVVRRDGRGRRPPPQSRRSWEVGTCVEQRR